VKLTARTLLAMGFAVALLGLRMPASAAIYYTVYKGDVLGGVDNAGDFGGPSALTGSFKPGGRVSPRVFLKGRRLLPENGGSEAAKLDPLR